jgi:D-alanyl-lipoteichoic acid acyltransferase DltB (MBOAT superfamily)
MNLVSWECLGLLALALAAFHTVPAGLRVHALLAFSWAFYAWIHPPHAAVLAGVTVLHYAAGRFLHGCASPRKRRVAFIAVIAATLAALGWFKYADFGLTVFRQALGLPGPGALDILLPVGISFYTLQCLGCTVDVWRGQQAPERSFAHYALFVAFFPQLIAGPIERGRDLLPQLKRLEPQDASGLEEGFRLLLLGLAKKGVLADRLRTVALPLVAEPADDAAPALLLGLVALFFMLYFDFAAYTDMARGSARLFGVRLSENFAAPLLASNPAEFWRRWHMTLSTWVRDYIFIPLGGMRPRHWAYPAAALGAMALMGLWHGASWNFVLWGVFHGAVLVAHGAFHQAFKARLRRLPAAGRMLTAAGGWAITLACHAAAMAWFFTPDPSSAWALWARCADPAAWRAAGGPALPWLAALLALLVALEAAAHHGRFRERLDRAPAAFRAAWCLALLAACILLGGEGAAPFVYLRF